MLPCPGTFYITCFGWLHFETGVLPSPALEPKGAWAGRNSGHTWRAVSKVTYWLMAACTVTCTYCLLSPRERLHFLHLCCKLPWRFSVNRWSSDTTKGNEYPKYIKKSFLQIIRSTLLNQGFIVMQGDLMPSESGDSRQQYRWTWVRSVSWMTGWTFMRRGICTFSSKMNHSDLI